ncbi:hypothetical protein F2P79_014477 [Pimephales promelas]|nr:hypothetical protein F2P79_014477 [Pimephales promelas]
MSQQIPKQSMWILILAGAETSSGSTDQPECCPHYSHFPSKVLERRVTITEEREEGDDKAIARLLEEEGEGSLFLCLSFTARPGHTERLAASEDRPFLCPGSEGSYCHLSPHCLSGGAYGGDGEANGCWDTKPSALGRYLLRICILKAQIKAETLFGELVTGQQQFDLRKQEGKVFQTCLPHKTTAGLLNQHTLVWTTQWSGQSAKRKAFLSQGL